MLQVQEDPFSIQNFVSIATTPQKASTMHQSTAAVLLSVLSCATAFPAIPEMGTVLQKRVEPGPRAPLGRLNRPNTGLPPTGFIPADQYVDVTDGGNHRFVPPAGSDRRGQCPGLNAAANHGFLKYDTVSWQKDCLLMTAVVAMDLRQSLKVGPVCGRRVWLVQR